MFDFRRCAPQVPVVLASLVLWVSFAWGLPAEAPAPEREADVAPQNPWAGVRMSDAYDYAKCPRCPHKNEVRRPACYRCGYSLPQPSAELAYPPWVFVPGKGYYREGTLVEPAESWKGLWVTGLVLTGSGVFTLGVAAEATGDLESPGGWIVAYIAAPIVMGLGVVLLIVGRAKSTEPVYAFASGERYGPYEPPAFALRSADSDRAALKIEVTVLGF